MNGSTKSVRQLVRMPAWREENCAPRERRGRLMGQALVGGLFACWACIPAWAVSVKTTMANAEVVVPDVTPMQGVAGVQDALSGWLDTAPMSLKPVPDPLPARPGKPGNTRLRLAGTSADILDCPDAVAEIRREMRGASQQMAYNGDLFQACIYPFAKGSKVYLRAVNIDAAESSLTHRLFSGIANSVRGTPSEWLTRRLNDFIADIKKKLPGTLVERIEAPGVPVQSPDREAVVALLPPEPVAAQPAPTGQTMTAAQDTATPQPDGAVRTIEARKNLTAMGLTYHSQTQFIDAVRRKDALAVKLFLDGGGIDPSAKGGDGKRAVDIARESGASEIVALLTPQAASTPTPVAPARQLPPGVFPASGMMPPLTPEQKEQMRQQMLEAIRQQQQGSR